MFIVTLLYDDRFIQTGVTFFEDILLRGSLIVIFLSIVVLTISPREHFHPLQGRSDTTIMPETARLVIPLQHIYTVMYFKQRLPVTTGTVCLAESSTIASFIGSSCLFQLVIVTVGGVHPEELFTRIYHSFPTLHVVITIPHLKGVNSLLGLFNTIRSIAIEDGTCHIVQQFCLNTQCRSFGNTSCPSSQF